MEHQHFFLAGSNMRAHTSLYQQLLNLPPVVRAQLAVTFFPPPLAAASLSPPLAASLPTNLAGEGAVGRDLRPLRHRRLRVRA